jgi:CHAT domain-containing protein/tetratricopeptide (TPR) repeat protein
MQIDLLSDDERAILLLLSTLQECDITRLSVVGFSETHITQLLRSGYAIRSAESPTTYALRPDIQIALQNYLQTETPNQALVLHEQAFRYFLDWMRSAANPKERDRAEINAIRHLEILRHAISERREWQRLHSYVAQLKQTGLQIPRHMHLTMLYEGSILIREQNYGAGEALLLVLLDKETLDADLRMRSKNLLAQCYWFRADYDSALSLYHEAYQLAVALDDKPYQGHALHNMSLVFHEIGDYLRAFEMSNQSLLLFRTIGDIYHEGHVLYEVAKNAFQLGRLDQAQHYFSESTVIYTRLGMRAQLANLYTLQGMLFHALDEPDSSIAFYDKSLAISLSDEHADRPVSMDTWMFMGLLYQTQQHWHDAEVAYRHGGTIAAELQHKHALALGSFRLGQLAENQQRLETALEHYQQAITQLEAMRSAAEMEEVKLGLLGVTQQTYESIILLLLKCGQISEAFHYVERARSRAFLDLLMRKSPELYLAYDQPVVTLADIQEQLAPHALLLEYYTTGVLPAGEHLVHKLKHTNPQLFACLVNPPKTFLFVITKTACDVIDLSFDPNLLRSAANSPMFMQALLQKRKLQSLYQYFIGPIERELTPNRVVYLIPHGPLHQVPFLALQAADGSYLLQESGPVIAFAPSATILIRNCLARPIQYHGSFLALGYNDPTVPLQHAEAEARGVAAMLHGSALTGMQPKRTTLLEHIGTLAGLHIAGHAEFHPTNPLRSSISIGHEETLDAAFIMQYVNLQPILVSLSACTSGQSKIVAGDELFGLLRSWLYAGAVAVVCSFWDANDIVSRLMMERFYQNIRDGMAMGIAFRDAVVSIRETTGRELAELFAHWRTQDAAISLPEITPELYETFPYRDPSIWATFMLIGRA